MQVTFYLLGFIKIFIEKKKHCSWPKKLVTKQTFGLKYLHIEGKLLKWDCLPLGSDSVFIRWTCIEKQKAGCSCTLNWVPWTQRQCSWERDCWKVWRKQKGHENEGERMSCWLGISFSWSYGEGMGTNEAKAFVSPKVKETGFVTPLLVWGSHSECDGSSAVLRG